MAKKNYQHTRTAPASADGGWIYGRHAVRAALANPARQLRRVLALQENAEEVRGWLKSAQAGNADPGQLEVLAKPALDALLPRAAVHQGVALSTEPLDTPDIDDLIDGLPEPTGTERQIVLLLDQITDPQNIGAILRSAAAFGVRAVVMPDHGTPPVTGSLAKAASGAVEHVALIRVVNLSRAIERLQAAGFWCVGLDSGAEQNLPDLAAASLAPPGRVVLVLGAEDTGLRRLTRAHCDFVAKLPTKGAIASLNVSNAAAVALYELARNNPS